MRADVDKLSTPQPAPAPLTCPPNEFLRNDGMCFTCPPNSTHDSSGMCFTCPPNSILKDDGMCQYAPTCPLHYLLTTDNKTCSYVGPLTCPPNYFLSIDKMCYPSNPANPNNWWQGRLVPGVTP